MNTIKNFSGRAEDYAAGRPNYAADFIEFLYSDCGFDASSIIADIGSGTGKLSRQLLERGSKVICVEPNEDMRFAAERLLSKFDDFCSIDGSCDNTKIKEKSVDFITAAQAFHWFDAESFKAESKRILKPEGKVILVYNTRDLKSAFNIECYKIYQKYCPLFKGYHNGMKDDDERICSFFNYEYKKVSFKNPLLFTKDKFISRCLSSSYSIKSDNQNYDDYIKSLEVVFDKYAKKNNVVMDNDTVAYIGKI